MRTTFMAKPKDIEQKWHLIDVEGKTLGRLATEVASLLRGKHKPEFTPHVDTGDHVVIINAEKVVLTGNKLADKKYYRHSGYTGGMREMTATDMQEKFPERMVEIAIRGMLPKTKLARAQIKKLHVFAGGKHTHQAQQPVEYELKG